MNWTVQKWFAGWVVVRGWRTAIAGAIRVLETREGGVEIFWGCFFWRGELEEVSCDVVSPKIDRVNTVDDGLA